MEHLAAELLETILSLAATPDEGLFFWTRLKHRNESLLSFSLVSRGWTVVAQDLLYRHVRLPARSTPLAFQVEDWEGGPEQQERCPSDWQLLVDSPKTGVYNTRKLELIGYSAEAVTAILSSKLRGVQELDISKGPWAEGQAISITAFSHPSLKDLRKLTIEDTLLTYDWQGACTPLPEGRVPILSLPFQLESLTVADGAPRLRETRPPLYTPPVLLLNSAPTLRHLHLAHISPDLHDALSLVLRNLESLHFPVAAATEATFLQHLTRAALLTSLSLDAIARFTEKEVPLTILTSIFKAIPASLYEVSLVVSSLDQCRFLVECFDQAPSLRSTLFVSVICAFENRYPRGVDPQTLWDEFATECGARGIVCTYEQRRGRSGIAWL